MMRPFQLAVIVVFLLVPGASVHGELSEETCRYARDRAEASVLRARRSVARANIAALRLVAELQEAGLPVSKLTSLDPKPPRPELEVGTFEEMAAAAWSYHRYASRVEALVEEEMAPRLRPNPEPSGLGPHVTVDEEELHRPKDSPHAACLAWALYVERAAFRAEQAAQLIEVATDQAIALSDHEIRKRDG